MFDNDTRAKIIEAINMDNWKHSWHLPKNEAGCIDWYNDETKNKIAEILNDKIGTRLEEISKLRQAMKFLQEN